MIKLWLPLHAFGNYIYAPWWSQPNYRQSFLDSMLSQDKQIKLRCVLAPSFFFCFVMVISPYMQFNILFCWLITVAINVRMMCLNLHWHICSGRRSSYFCFKYPCYCSWHFIFLWCIIILLVPLNQSHHFYYPFFFKSGWLGTINWP